MTGSIVRKGIGLALIAVLVALAVFFIPALSEPEDAGIGIKVGETAPTDIPFRNQAGEKISLAEVAGPNGTVLVLVRSVDWCPFCAAQVKDHAEVAEDLGKRGFTLASLSYDEPAILGEFKQDFELPYLMLSDVESRFVTETGLLDPQYEQGSKAYGVPYATVLVLAPDGTVLNKLVSADYRQRPSNKTLLKLVDGIAG